MPVTGTVAEALTAGTPAENVTVLPISAEQSVAVSRRTGLPTNNAAFIFLF